MKNTLHSKPLVSRDKLGAKHNGNDLQHKIDLLMNDINKNNQTPNKLKIINGFILKRK